MEAIPVGQNAHACLDANKRTYDYFFHDFPDAILERTSAKLDLTRFNTKEVVSAIPRLLQCIDFREFCLTPDRHNSTVVQLFNVTLFRNRQESRFRIRFEADRFLRGMIRVLVNDLVSLGKGELTTNRLTSMLNGNSRGHKVHLAPPQGLFLTGVRYPYLDGAAELPVCGREDWLSLCPTRQVTDCTGTR